MIHLFYTAIPGQSDTGEMSDVWGLGKTGWSKDGQKDHVSSIAPPPLSSGSFSSTSVFAVGACSLCSVYIYIYNDRTSSGTDLAGTVLYRGIWFIGHSEGFAKKLKLFEYDNDGRGNTEEADKVDIFS